jgi:hypothetical protein
MTLLIFLVGCVWNTKSGERTYQGHWILQCNWNFQDILPEFNTWNCNEPRHPRKLQLNRNEICRRHKTQLVGSWTSQFFSVAFESWCLISVLLRLGVMIISCMFETARKVMEAAGCVCVVDWAEDVCPLRTKWIWYEMKRYVIRSHEVYIFYNYNLQ